MSHLAEAHAGQEADAADHQQRAVQASPPQRACGSVVWTTQFRYYSARRNGRKAQHTGERIPSWLFALAGMRLSQVVVCLVKRLRHVGPQGRMHVQLVCRACSTVSLFP